jgi:hypothetical protein
MVSYSDERSVLLFTQAINDPSQPMGDKSASFHGWFAPHRSPSHEELHVGYF